MDSFSLVLLTRALVYGGAERQVVALAKGLQARGHRVTVLTYYGGGPLAPALAHTGVSHVSLGKRSRWDLVRPYWRAIRILRAINPDIVHGYLDDANLAATLMRLAVPRAGLVWGIRGSRLDFKAYPLIVRAIFHLGCWFAGAADIVISNSFSGAADHIAVGYPEDRMRVIPNGIDTEHFHPDEKARAELREEWRVREDAPLIGIVGRIDPMKDHPTFLHAAAIFAKERPEARFVCVGNGSPKYLESMLSLTRTLGLERHVKWLPAQAAIRDTYNALDLLTSSSAYGEGFSNVIGEAMSCGTRCVVTDVGDSARIVGCTGIAVPPSNPPALAEGWRRAFDKFREADRSEPRQRIELEFSLERLLDRTEALLGDLETQGSRV